MFKIGVFMMKWHEKIWIKIVEKNGYLYKIGQKGVICKVEMNVHT